MGKKHSSKQKAAYLSCRTLCRSKEREREEESGLVEGPHSAASAKETFGKKNLGLQLWAWLVFQYLLSPRNIHVFVVYLPSFFFLICLCINQAGGAY